jgi:hypothetical protein
MGAFIVLGKSILKRAESAVWSISRVALLALALLHRWHGVTRPGGLRWVSV